jgi:hypothetical protein
MQDLVARPADERPVRLEAERARLRLELRLGRAGPGDDEAHAAEPLDQPRHGLEREVEALLVDQPADEQHELLVGRREARAQARQVGHRLQVGGVDAVRDHRDPAGRDPERAGDVLAHVRRARDHAVRAAHHPLLDAVDVRLGVLVHPALVAAVLRGVHGHEPRHAPAAGELARGVGDEPVVGVDQVEAPAELEPRGAHVRVHPVDPGDEGVDVAARELRLAHAVDGHAVAVLGVPSPVAIGRAGRSGRLATLVAPGEDVHLGALRDELLGELAHVPGEAALHHGRVLPGEDEDAHGRPGMVPVGSAWRWSCGGCATSSPWRATGPSPARPRSCGSRSPRSPSRSAGSRPSWA